MLPNNSNKNFVDDLLATLKAVSKKENIKLNFVDNANDFFTLNQTIVGGDKITIPKSDNIKKSRFAIDLAACYLLFHDKKIFAQTSQIIDNIAEQKLFEDFEKIRVIANVKDLYKGVLKNIVQKISADVKGQFIQDSSALPLILLGKILQKEIVETQIADKKIAQYLDKIVETISNQQEFAAQIRSFLDFLRRQNEVQENEDKNPQEKKQEAQKKPQDGEVNLNEETPQSETVQDLQEEEKSASNPPPQEKMAMPLINEGGLEALQLKDNSASASEEKIEFKNLYHVYTNKFDEVIIPQKLVGKNDLEILRYGLELRISNLKGISRKLALKLKKKLMAKKQYHVEQSDSSGILDRKRFVQMIIDPTFENYFIDEKQHEYHDTIVTILLDNSGSMRGQPIVMSALACEIIASILEKFSIKTEILGFTTSDWKGGKARKLWEAQNKPANPGRLSDLRHIIYKSAGQNLKKSKVNLGLMLKEGLLKENIDGEALLWARSRLMQRSEKRKILMIISDGTPVDDSTNSVNESEILIDHLHHVIHLIEKHSKIEIVGIGIGHHVDNFYRNSISIKSVDDLGDVMIEKIADLV